MKQYEAVIKVMEENGGYATLGFLNQKVLKISGCEWKTRTPFASIRRIVQNERLFFKIRPGLWALKSYKDKLPPEIQPVKGQPEAEVSEYSHTYYQGLLVEIGNFKKRKTIVPNQDKNKLFLGKRLSEIATVSEMYPFGYKKMINTAKTIDVIWFNERIMPESFFEIEHSTDINNSLRKFVEFQDFYASFRIVADEVRRREFENKLLSAAFVPIKDRVKFWSYDLIAKYHYEASQLIETETRLNS